MKLSSQEEYGLRCLLLLARQPVGDSLTISEVGAAEGVSPHNVAKYFRLLRQGGFVGSERGPFGRTIDRSQVIFRLVERSLQCWASG